MQLKPLRKTVFSAMFLAIGLVLPFLTGQIPSIGNMLLPMHLPVLICSAVCGWKYGLVTGFVLPLLRSLLFSRPVLYPGAIAMAFELATYGFTFGFFLKKSPWQNLFSLYGALLSAMISGRIIWAIAQTILLGLQHKPFTFEYFLAETVYYAIPGILLQLILIPSVLAITGYIKRK